MEAGAGVSERFEKTATPPPVTNWGLPTSAVQRCAVFASPPPLRCAP